MLDLSNRKTAFVIAEAGTCHASPDPMERLWRAKRYVLAARDAGADCVKFQIFDETPLFCPYEGDEIRAHRWMDSVMDFGDWCQVKEFAEACGMVFLASVFQHSTVDWLMAMDVQATKVASRAAEKFPYGNAPAPYLVSLGMTDYVATDYPTFHLECESKYPSTKAWSGETFGFSDHSGTPQRAIEAIEKGCKLVEVHFRIDPIDAGPDLPASLNLKQLARVCQSRRKA